MPGDETVQTPAVLDATQPSAALLLTFSRFRAMRARLLLLSVVVLLHACRRADLPAPSAQTPVILISIDTLRSDHLPAYGYAGVATPHIDAFRKDAILYSRAYSHCPLTVPSHATVFTGLLPAETGMRDNTGYDLATGAVTLAELLSRNGYATGAAVSAYVLRKGRGLERGFQFYDDVVDAERMSVSMAAVQRKGAETVAAAKRWISTAAGKPLFFFLHLYEPHSPYEPPEPYRTRYGLYDGEIARADEIFGDFIGFLKERELYDKSLIIFFSDHGEGLSDHGEEEHGIFLYREAIQVPLIVKLPRSAQAGSQVTTPAQLSDIFPTVVQQTATKYERASAAGSTSLLELGRSEASARRIYSETYFPRFHFGWSDLHSLIDGEHHYIQAPQAELYDVARDPAEKRNILTEQRRVVAAMRQTIAPLIKTADAPQAISAEEAAKLAALGYLGSAAPSTGPLPDPKTKVETFRTIREAFKLFRAGRYEEALAFYQGLLRENPRMLDLWDISARALIRLGRTDEAIRAAKEGLKISPQATHIALIVANLAIEKGNLDEAQAHAELAVRSHPGEAHDVLARIALARGDIAAAEREAHLALREREEDVRAQVILARIDVEKKNFESAAARLEKARHVLRAKKSSISGFHVLHGDVLARLGRGAEAEQAFREEIRLFPEEPQAYKNLILLYVAEGRLEEATRVIHELEKASPTPPAYVAISDTLRIVGDQQGARFWALRGLKRFPRDTTLRRLAG